MVSFNFISILLASSAAVMASPIVLTGNENISARQAIKIPKNSLYIVEWYPDGCRKGGGITLNGYEEVLSRGVQQA
ncbi:hypothetical protein DHEL01_v208612 [Diaporthe helianthi]|uniref:Uncharacterized protein n=1 Tax=Diaporthe helianthi TaxID=158607 RepID=A0A2P5HRY6_DIAHE|nr:hypothetical protein DHEL01_v208612 [Diaporthe helianthi]